MVSNLTPIGCYQAAFNSYLPYNLPSMCIYQSTGLEKHILKRHPECIKYIRKIPSIISHPDYIGINPNEPMTSFELVKIFPDNIQIGIKLDTPKNYLYVATLHSITAAKLERNVSSGRLKKFDN